MRLTICVILDETNRQCYVKLSDRVRWLAEQFPRTQGLQTQHCRSVVEDFVQEHFYSRVLYNLKQRKLQGYLHQVTSRPMLYCGSFDIFVETIFMNQMIFSVLTWNCQTM